MKTIHWNSLVYAKNLDAKITISDTIKPVGKFCGCKPRIKNPCPTQPKPTDKVEVNINNSQYAGAGGKAKDSSKCCMPETKTICCIAKPDAAIKPVATNPHIFCFVPLLLYVVIAMFQFLTVMVMHRRNNYAYNSRKLKNSTLVFHLTTNFIMGTISILMTYGFITGFGPQYIYIILLFLFLIAFVLLFKFFRDL